MARKQDESDTKPETEEAQGKAEDQPTAESQTDRAEASDSEQGPSIGSDTGSPGRDPDKPMNDAQRTYLEPLAESQDAEVSDDMSEAEAAGTIDRLQENAVHVY